MSRFPVPELIETDRLVLRRPRPDDAQSIFAGYAQDPEVVRFLMWRPHTSIAETQEFLERAAAEWEQGSSFTWAIQRASEETPIGMIELRPRRHAASVGYVLSRSAWNQGYITEAVRAVIEVAFADPAVFRVWAVCDVENLASARVMEKAGMEREGLLRRHTVHPNLSPEPRDVFIYAKVR